MPILMAAFSLSEATKPFEPASCDRHVLREHIDKE